MNASGSAPGPIPKLGEEHHWQPDGRVARCATSYLKYAQLLLISNGKLDRAVKG